MSISCGIVEDLLPLYLDGVLCDESRSQVEEHLTQCERCHRLAEAMRKSEAGELVKPLVTDGTKVLQEYTFRITRQAVARVIGIGLMIGYWICFMVSEYMGRYGRYLFDSYNLYELLGLGMILLPLINLLWWGAVILEARRRKTTIGNRGLLVALTLFLLFHAGLFVFRGYQTSHSGIVVVESVEPGRMVIEHGGEEIEIEIPMMLDQLIEADGETRYLISYERRGRGATAGDWKLCYIEKIVPEK